MTSHLGIKTYRFGETAPHWYGKEAAAIRRQILAEQAEALARYDADPTDANRAAFAGLADTEAEVARRLLARGFAEPALVYDGAPLRGRRPTGFDPARGRAA